jgi:multidrug efflux pump subunit AcrA (membrane-fusion protein)
MRPLHLLVAFLALALLVALGALFFDRGTRDQSAPAAADVESQADRQEHEAIVLEATLEPAEMVEVYSEVNGELSAIYVKAGDEVLEGDVLGQVFNPSLATDKQALETRSQRLNERYRQQQGILGEARLALSQAELSVNRSSAELLEVQAEAERQRTLYEEGATPRLTYEAAQRQFLRRKSEHEAVVEVRESAAVRLQTEESSAKSMEQERSDLQLELMLQQQESARGEILAPASGVVEAVLVEEGTTISASTGALLRIALGLDPLVAVVSPDARQMELLTAGRIVQVQPLGFGEKIDGIVKGVRRNQVLIEFPNLDDRAQPGMSASVTVLPD